jgi:hypothetical protein
MSMERRILAAGFFGFTVLSPTILDRANQHSSARFPPGASSEQHLPQLLESFYRVDVDE